MGTFSVSTPPPPQDPSTPTPTTTLLVDDDDDHDSSNPTTALLSPTSPPPTSSSRFLPSFLLFSTFISTAFAIAFAYLFFSTSHSHPITTTTTTSNPIPPPPPLPSPPPPSPPPPPPILTSRPLTKLHQSTVILISSDGFRFGYQHKTQTPNIHRLIQNGTEAETGLISVFPTLTFPNHYSIVTGLYPPYHGIINNRFTDPVTGDLFTMASHEPHWWLGEPIWETVSNSGKLAATYFWPGSEVPKGSWSCNAPKYCQHYDGTVPFEHRVDTVLGYFDLPWDQMPVFMTLYFEDPDHQGHQVGPDDPEITSAVARIDDMIGRLIEGLEKRGVFEDVSVILLGDHGMVGTCDKKLVFVDDFGPWIKIPHDWVQSTTPVLAIAPPSGVSLKDLVDKMNEALSSGKINNGGYLKMYLKEDLPKRLHYADSYRIPPIIGLLEEGYKVELKRSRSKECGGAHGYDNDFFSMRTIFVAHGPQFERGRKVPSFQNVEIYNLIMSILKLKGAPNNGSASFPSTILLPSA